MNNKPIILINIGECKKKLEEYISKNNKSKEEAELLREELEWTYSYPEHSNYRQIRSILMNFDYTNEEIEKAVKITKKNSGGNFKIPIYEYVIPRYLTKRFLFKPKEDIIQNQIINLFNLFNL